MDYQMSWSKPARGGQMCLGSQFIPSPWVGQVYRYEACIGSKLMIITAYSRREEARRRGERGRWIERERERGRRMNSSSRVLTVP